MLQQGWYGCYDCTNYAAERDPDQRTDYRYILYKVYSRYRRHKAAQIKAPSSPRLNWFAENMMHTALPVNRSGIITSIR